MVMVTVCHHSGKISKVFGPFFNKNELLSNTKAKQRNVLLKSSPLLLRSTRTKGPWPVTGTPGVSAPTSGAQAEAAGARLPASQPSQGVRSIFSSILGSKLTWLGDSPKRQPFLDL